MVVSRRRDQHLVRTHAIRIGFLPLIDAAPLIVASELGYFDDEGLDVELEPQIGWGNVRDRLTYGQLHASHAPLGIVPASVAGLEHYDQPLLVLMGLGAGGNAITISRELADVGTNGGANGAAPARWRRHLKRALNLAYVFSVASHHFLLRELLDRGGLTPADASLCVMPPTQMTDLLHRGILDGYCAGEPWNTLAEERGCGKVVIATTELAPDHPEKALVVTRKWQAQNPGNAERLVRATLRGCAFCDDPVNRSRLTEILAGPRYLALPERIIARSLSIDEWLHPGAARPRFRTFASSVLAPTVERIVWIVERMMRWGDLPADTDVPRLAGVCVDLQTFDRAAGALRPGKNHPAPVARASTYMEGSLI